MVLGSIESLVIATLASSKRPMAMWELRQQVLQKYQAEHLTNGAFNERSFLSSFSRALRNMERKGLVHLSLRPSVADWPNHQSARSVYRVELMEQVA